MRRCPRELSIAVLVATALLAGCMPDQATDVALYRNTLALGDLPSAPAEGEPLSLRRAAELANATSERLAIQGEELVRAYAQRRRSVAQFLPTVDLLSSLVFQDEGGGDEFIDTSGAVVGGGGSSTQFDVDIAARVTLFDGFRNVNRLKSSDADIENRRALLLDLRETLLLDVVGTYYAVLVAERSVEVLERSLTVQAERLRDIQGRQEAGVARPLDVAQTEAQVAGTRVALRDAQNRVETGRELLAYLVGAPIQRSPLDDGFDVPDEVPDGSQLDELARMSRQDLAAAEAAARAARADVDVAIGQYAPTISVNLDYFLRRDSVPTDRDWAGLLSANVPIFTAGRIEADIQDAWAVFRQQVLAYQGLRRQIRQEIAIAIANVQASRDRLAERDVQVRAAREAYRQADGSYQVGLATNLERLVALDQVLNAELGQALEIYRLRELYAALLRSTGGLTEGLTGVAPALPPPQPAPESPFITAQPTSNQ